MLTQLNIFEFSVIYLTLGAPLGVYHVASHWGDSLLSTISLAILNVCIWPIAALVFVYSHLRGRDRSFKSAQEVCQPLLHVANNSLSTDELFVFRDALSRYVGICEALESPIGNSAVDGLSEIVEYPYLAATKACNVRRNRARLYLQQVDARRVFLAQVRAMACTEPLVLKLASDLAASLGDHIASDELRSMRSDAGSIHISSDRVSMAA
jgi:hypothetical protein